MDTQCQRWTIFQNSSLSILGFQENGIAVNQNLPYIKSDHYVAGLEYIPTKFLRFTLEGFYKKYDDYPISVRDGISLANLGGDFGIVGNEAVSSTGKGETYGLEWFAQQKLTKNMYFTTSYTLFWSSFSGQNGEFIRSSWDTRHLVAILMGYKFSRNWELGIRWRFQGGTPYTPFDLERSRINYAVEGRGTLDYNQLNSDQLPNFNQLDLRLDKKWNFKRITFDLFLDLQNVLVRANPSFPNYTFKRTADNSAFETTDGAALRPDGANAFLYYLKTLMQICCQQ